MSDTGTGPRGTPVTAAGLETQAEHLRQRIEELHRMQGKGKYITLLLVLVIVVEFGVFYTSTRRKVEANFSGQSMQQAMSQRLAQLLPELRDMVVKAGRNALPVYRQLAVARFQQVGPDVAKDAMARLKSIPADVGNELGLSLSKAFDETLTRLRPDILKTYPNLTDEQKLALLRVALYDKIEQQNGAIQSRLTSITEGEKSRMTSLLVKFEPSKATGAPSDSSRERLFLHTLVDVLLDTGFQTDVLAEDAAAAPALKAAKPAAKEVSGGVAKPVAGEQITGDIQGN